MIKEVKKLDNGELGFEFTEEEMKDLNIKPNDLIFWYLDDKNHISFRVIK